MEVLGEQNGMLQFEWFQLVVVDAGTVTPKLKEGAIRTNWDVVPMLVNGP